MMAWFGGCVAEEARVERAPGDRQADGAAVVVSAVFSGTVTSEQGTPQAGVIDFADIVLGTHPCHSHVWFQL